MFSRPTFVPILWKSIGMRFLRLFLLFQISCLILIVLSRLDMVATYLASGGTLLRALHLLQALFIVYFPPIMPFATLLCAFITTHGLKRHITTLSSCGLSPYQLLYPLYALVAFLALGNFYLANIWSPYMRCRMHHIVWSPLKANPQRLLTQAQKPFVYCDNYLFYPQGPHTYLWQLGSWDIDDALTLRTQNTQMLAHLSLPNHPPLFLNETVQKASAPLSHLLTHQCPPRSIALTDILYLSELSSSIEHQLERARRYTHLIYPLLFVYIGAALGLRGRYGTCASCALLTLACTFIAKTLSPLCFYLPLVLLGAVGHPLKRFSI